MAPAEVEQLYRHVAEVHRDFGIHRLGRDTDACVLAGPLGHLGFRLRYLLALERGSLSHIVRAVAVRIKVMDAIVREEGVAEDMVEMRMGIDYHKRQFR
jgi:hypothetical protein